MNRVPRLLGLPRRPWTCYTCRTALRGLQTTSKPRSQAIPSMQQLNQVYSRRNQNILYYTLSVILGTVALSYGSVPLYKTICQQTGWGGQPINIHDISSSPSDRATRLTPDTTVPRIRITFAGSTSDILPWKFTPQQREVRVLPGETALAFYTATNQSPDEDIIGVATYSVTPAQVAPYFSKIQCFCFEEQRLNRGETVDMPVFFYIDPEIKEDVNCKGIGEVTLNYTFFKAKYGKDGTLSPVPTPY
ncbi:cytochrome c oxidase assembly protein CtaG/Cox11-domain-containing protein [Elsinoe ampelina]|uniref:Cytochrome c oxidase assembly protein CtaG/Cox11-domain-containing protein n=1 Tax=Elsinoe ampelina TaxID=302913 RepID=A0A6A6GA42_9PEZI|nr:cytochrome c oxidase assembly protein CtaG/Cox11-domain-containing protein [Elsinoe ampelina]